LKRIRMIQEYSVFHAHSIWIVKEIKKQHGNNSRYSHLVSEINSNGWYEREDQRNTVQYILPAMRFIQEWKQRGECVGFAQTR